MLEQLYSPQFLKEHPAYAFLLGIAYSAVGIGASVILFPQDPALISVLIISVLFLPSLYRLALIEEREQKAKGLLKAIYNQRQFIKVYFYAFFGMFITYAFFSTIMPNLAASILFKEQLAIIGGPSGGASFSGSLFQGILSNNLKILLICFVVSLVMGNGSIFLITWNASVWGTIFGNVAKSAAFAVGKNPFIYLVLILISVLPHVILEIGSYIFATISGTEVSEGFLREKFGSNAFRNLMIINALILLTGIILLLLGAVVETYALSNFETYRIIIRQAFG
jgi:uncharacterized membrane protein SpoIIM required for sporulation